MIRPNATAITCLIALASLASCDAKERDMAELPQISSNLKKQLAFTCSREKDHIPPREPDADLLYKHARWLIRKNILKKDPGEYPRIERLLRVATAHGHDRANIELRQMLDKGQAVSADPVNEAIDLTQDLIRRGIPSGYYDMGWYLEHGYGVKADRDLAFKYYRRAADLGSPEGQYLVGDKLSDAGANGPEVAEIGWSMYRCAAEQNHPKAANEFAIHLRQSGRRSEAAAYFQLAASAGDPGAALSLAEAFGKKSRAPLWDLGQDPDPERERRYRNVWSFLSDYSYLTPSVPELNRIVPLPPAALAPWDGKFQWLEDHKSNTPPPLPAEDRIADMARAKGLDPKTGRLAARSG